ncbi:hypothetical protein TNCV_4530031 [Trichonephila clavipes]|nr:hypothetical protein TNCV_4530031 [Trichonephila clavipes]
MSLSILTSRYSATRGLLETDYVILNYGQVTRTPPEQGRRKEWANSVKPWILSVAPSGENQRPPTCPLTSDRDRSVNECLMVRVGLVLKGIADFHALNRVSVTTVRADWKYKRIYNPQRRLRVLVEKCRKDS